MRSARWSKLNAVFFGASTILRGKGASVRGSLETNGLKSVIGPSSNTARPMMMYCPIMLSVRDVLKGRPGAWCLDCLVRHTRDRASHVIRELDALAARAGEGRCGTCAETGSVFSSPRTK